VPAEKEQAANLLRYFETSPDANGAFSFSNVAPGRYLILPRIEPDFDVKARSAAMNVASRNILRHEAEAFNNLVELKSCQRRTELNLKIPN
jgi:hypothetical protein